MGHRDGPEEQRQHPRVSVKKRVWCEGENLSLYVQALDMSLGGAFIQASQAPDAPERSDFELSFSLDDDPVRMRVEVVWSRPQDAGRPAGIGVRILEIDQGADAYKRFLEQAFA